MIKGLILVVSLLAAALFQSTSRAGSWVSSLSLPLLILVVLYYALVHEAPFYLAASFVGGLFQDGLSLVALGTSSCCFIVIGWSCFRVRHLVYTPSVVTHMWMGGLCSAAACVSEGLLLMLHGDRVVTAGGFITRVVSALIMGMLLMPVVYRFLHAFDRSVGVSVEGGPCT